ncbi:MAG: hypothetical protein LBR48_01805 [Dysgonamonadaceae bacterium]|jgi:acyl-ACP thioesterase|nr:hypothetical protein [Dysgonamonadaceae bacterium]
MAEKKSYIFQVRPHHVDFQNNVTLESLVGFFLGAAERNADEFGFGLLNLQERNHTWVLLRFVLEMSRIPVDKDVLTVATWIQDVNSTFTTRVMQVSDESGQVIGYASTSWAMLNMDTRQSVLLNTLPELNEYKVGAPIPLGDPPRIPNVKGEVENTFKVKYSDIDINRHANTMHYIQWIEDCFSIDYYAGHRLKRFEINFLKELVFGDSGDVYREMKAENDFLFQIVAHEKGNVCRARMLFEEV